MVAAVTALTLAVLAAVGMAATSASPNGCPTRQEHEALDDRYFSPPARLQIEGVRRAVRTDQQGDRQLHAEGTHREHLQPRRHRRDVYVRAVPYNQFNIPVEKPRERRHRDPRLPPRRELPCEQQTAAADALHPRDEAGRGPPRRCLDKTARRGQLLELTPVSCVRPRPSPLRRGRRSLHADAGVASIPLPISEFRGAVQARLEHVERGDARACAPSSSAP